MCDLSGLTADEIDYLLDADDPTALTARQRLPIQVDADSAELVSRNRLEVTVTHERLMNLPKTIILMKGTF